ncbi:MAG: class I SAM-dependent methyltransferase [Sporichthyaceae bacterium]|nr:class I SAM-dependent methyltransferase [Sporichthyaceae bacterium]
MTTHDGFDPATFDPAAYGSSAAADYDALHAELDPSDAVQALAALAGTGDVLEFGLGTGRLALPLVDLGFTVHGIEGSPAMVEALRAKPGGSEVPVVVGDFSRANTGKDDYSLVVLAINTIFALPSQEAQVSCFQNASRHLVTGGRFVVEAWVPDVGAFRNLSAVRPVRVHDGHIELEVATIDPSTQTMWTNKMHVTDTGVRLIAANHRYAWPSEMDLMARLAGMRLVHRWQDWNQSTFRDVSTSHISVWQKVSDHAV